VFIRCIIDVTSDKSQTRTFRSIKWLHDYSQRHPDLSDRDKRAAQRYLFYGERSIHDTVQVSLNGEKNISESGNSEEESSERRISVIWPEFVCQPAKPLEEEYCVIDGKSELSPTIDTNVFWSRCVLS